LLVALYNLLMMFTSNDISILVVIGPSGTGKSTAIRLLSSQHLIEVVPTWTTRPARLDELENGIEHKFVSEPEFQKALNSGLLLETRRMFGLPYLYGLPKIEKPVLERIPLIVLRASILDLFTRHYSNYIIYQVVDSKQKVGKRLNARKLHGEEIGLRLDNFEKEIELGNKMAKRTFINNSSPDKLVNQLTQAIKTDFTVSL
jgi:guanylate kinase